MSVFSNMFNSATSIVGAAASPYLTYLKIAGVVAVAAFVGFMYWQWQSEKAEAVRLGLEVDRQQSQINGLKVVIQNKDTAIKALEDIQAQTAKDTQTENEIQQEIGNAPTSDDGPVAPVLDRALRAIDRLRDGPKPKN